MQKVTPTSWVKPHFSINASWATKTALRVLDVKQIQPQGEKSDRTPLETLTGIGLPSSNEAV